MGNLFDIFRDERRTIISANTDLAATAEEYVRTKTLLAAKTQERNDIIKKARALKNSYDESDEADRSTGRTMNTLGCRMVYAHFDNDKVMELSARLRDSFIKDAEIFDRISVLAQQGKEIDREITSLRAQVERLNSRMERLAK